MNSTTFPIRGSAATRGEPTALAAVLLRMQTALSGLFSAQPGIAEASARLQRMADAYEATQPSFAADLRAAAFLAHRANDD